MRSYEQINEIYRAALGSSPAAALQAVYDAGVEDGKASIRPLIDAKMPDVVVPSEPDPVVPIRKPRAKPEPVLLTKRKGAKKHG